MLPGTSIVIFKEYLLSLLCIILLHVSSNFVDSSFIREALLDMNPRHSENICSKRLRYFHIAYCVYVVVKLFAYHTYG